MTYFQERTPSEILRKVRSAARNKYAWPGGYPLAVVMGEGEVVCPDCAKSNYKLISTSTRQASGSSWQAVGVEINYEDHDTYCANCDKQIEAAYGEDDDVVESGT